MDLTPDKIAIYGESYLEIPSIVAISTEDICKLICIMLNFTHKKPMSISIGRKAEYNNTSCAATNRDILSNNISDSQSGYKDLGTKEGKQQNQNYPSVTQKCPENSTDGIVEINSISSSPECRIRQTDPALDITSENISADTLNIANNTKKSPNGSYNLRRSISSESLFSDNTIKSNRPSTNICSDKHPDNSYNEQTPSYSSLPETKPNVLIYFSACLRLIIVDSKVEVEYIFTAPIRNTTTTTTVNESMTHSLSIPNDTTHTIIGRKEIQNHQDPIHGSCGGDMIGGRSIKVCHNDEYIDLEFEYSSTDFDDAVAMITTVSDQQSHCSGELPDLLSESVRYPYHGDTDRSASNAKIYYTIPDIATDIICNSVHRDTLVIAHRLNSIEKTICYLSAHGFAMLDSIWYACWMYLMVNADHIIHYSIDIRNMSRNLTMPVITQEPIEFIKLLARDTLPIYIVSMSDMPIFYRSFLDIAISDTTILASAKTIIVHRIRLKGSSRNQHFSIERDGRAYRNLSLRDIFTMCSGLLSNGHYAIYTNISYANDWEKIDCIKYLRYELIKRGILPTDTPEIRL